MKKTRSTPPPRDGIVRARPKAVEMRASEDEGMPTLTGHFAVFQEWTEINSMYEGHFLERIAPGAFKKTLKDQRDDVKVLFQHGHDPHIADKPLGPIKELREDSEGVFYEVDLIDTSYNRDLLPGLEAGLYGASFRFRVIQEEFDKEPERSDHNPDGIPERTIKELQLYEFGPVTFPAYANATAGVRSLTDEMELAYRMAADPERTAQLLNFASEESEEEEEPAADATPTAPPGAEEAHSETGGRSTQTDRNRWSIANHGKEWRLP